MTQEMIIQGRKLTPKDIELVKELLCSNPDWRRTRLSQELCKKWNWVNARGQLKDMAARSMLLKLERAGLIRLPERRMLSTNAFRNRKFTPVPHDTSPVKTDLSSLQPLKIEEVSHSKEELRVFNYFLSRYHYLGYKNFVGENMRYLVTSKDEMPLACLLFGAAAWKTAPRDNFIGWDEKTRKKNLGLIANNTRFLIVPWVSVPHLASHILGKIARRVSRDFMEKYGHEIYLLETFVQKNKFLGTSYRAGNWICVGDTKGRGKKGDNQSRLPIKSIWLYPLTRRFRAHLCS